MARAANTKAVTVYMSDQAIAQVNETAKKRGFKSSAEYFRSLVARDIEADGEAIDFGLDTWGRYSDSPPDDAKRKKSVE